MSKVWEKLDEVVFNNILQKLKHPRIFILKELDGRLLNIIKKFIVGCFNSNASNAPKQDGK